MIGSMQHPLKFILSQYPALGFALYRRYWFASFASIGATQLVTLGQGWLMFELTESALQLGVLGAAASVPNILMTLAGGVLADRFDKRQILMCTSALIATLLALLAWLDWSGLIQVWQLLTITALISLVTGIDWPTRVAIYPHLVERSAFISAVALNSFIWQSTRMAIPAVGGIIISEADTWVIFALGAIGFLTMFVVISGIHVRIPAATQDSAFEQLKQGVQYIWRTDLFRWLLTITFVGMFFAQSYVQIMPIFSDILEMGEQGYGYLLSAGGLGSIVGTLAIGSLDNDRPLGHFMLGGAAASVGALVSFVHCINQGWFTGALIAAFAFAALSSVYMITSMTIMQIRVPDQLRGRVMGIHTMGYSLMPLGGLFLGAVAERTGAGDAVLLAGMLYLAVVLWMWLSKPKLRAVSGNGD
jgi:predicted MFS family arabinose efflux permease